MPSSVPPELLPNLLDEEQEIPKWKVISKEDGPFFRGTSKGYPGNRTSQILGLTSVSTDPLVATIPTKIYSHDAITETLRDTPRLRLAQIQTFLQKALELKS